MNKKLLALIAMISVSSCSRSLESKFGKIIKEDLNKTIADFYRYEPLETKVLDSVFDSPYIDAEILQLAEEALEKATEAESIKKELDIYRDVYDEYFQPRIDRKQQEFDKAKDHIEYLLEKIRNRSSMIVPKFRGHEVKHTFRHTDSRGRKEIITLYYVIDEDKEEVVFRSPNNKKSAQINEVIEYALSKEK
ncbi:hypothetical protein [uncultured Porphyromonas sp.]|uniref:hypothetical protein n=1 Tax=uncultured Porphyromonas sp. TaxID=159274 RepID=UPI00263304CF|nr:hypothetical protein [uncultured Porphyromonas sp.]